MSARADLCGGRSAMIVPTATSPSVLNQFRFRQSEFGKLHHYTRKNRKRPKFPS